MTFSEVRRNILKDARAYSQFIRHNVVVRLDTNRLIKDMTAFRDKNSALSSLGEEYFAGDVVRDWESRRRNNLL